MELYIKVLVFIFGAIIGSFLNVVIYRMHTGRSINGRSHCMTCGRHLAWYDLFPIISFLILRGRCRSCTAAIPWRYLIVEALTGSSFLLLFELFRSDIVLFVLNTVLVSLLIVLTVYDIRHTIIPDELTIAVGAVALFVLGYGYLGHHDLFSVATHLVGGLIASGFFFGLWWVSRGRWIGLGDAKLALPLGVLVGLGGIFSMVVLSFWTGAAVSLVILGFQHVMRARFKAGKTSLLFSSHPLTIKSEVPFAPFLVLGFLLVHLFHVDILLITAQLFQGSL